MGLYKICEHKGRLRDRCEHAWWGSFRGIRVSLRSGRIARSTAKAEAQAVLDEVRTAIRGGNFDDARPSTAGSHAADFSRVRGDLPRAPRLAKGLSLGEDDRLAAQADPRALRKRALSDIKTADIEDFIADLRKPRIMDRQARAATADASVDQSHD